MTWWAQTLFWTLLGLIAGQAVLVALMVRLLRRFNRPAVAAAPYLPRTTVVLCLRGCDPFLSKCVEALLAQDYPNYDVHVIVDCREDPAWAIVEQVVQRLSATHAQISPLGVPRVTCSLKCSSLITAASGLDPKCEVLALLDADTIPHRTWLRELVAPLADPTVGATTGNRWYRPDVPSWGSMVRYWWNAAAVVQMYCYRIAWGGTLAIKTSVLRKSDLLDRWGQAFCEDTMLFSELRKQHLQLVFVPSLMMVNHEGCGLRGCYYWMRRQLLNARLYHPSWGCVMAHGVGTSLIQFVTLCLGIAAAVTGNGQACLWAIGGLLVYQVLMLGLLWPIENAIGRIEAARGHRPGAAAPLRAPVGLAIATLLLTQVVYVSALGTALFLRKVEWRGVWYTIDRSRRIKLVEYRPYSAEVEPAAAVVSL